VIATDADVDGMHILLVVNYFFAIFPELIKEGHLYILQTPLFRVQIRKKLFIAILMTNEKQPLKTAKTEITDLKVWERYPDEFKNFIGDTIRLDPVMMDKNTRLNNVSSTWGKYARPTNLSSRPESGIGRD
jgi:topoisomerase-4 subunit B